MSKKKSSKKKVVPLKPPTKVLKSRTLARKITTKFHKLTSRKEAEKDPKRIRELEEEIEEMGGRDAYQKASQLNTSIFSTSKWVWGKLSHTGRNFGVPSPPSPSPLASARPSKRPLKILEIGAINTQLLTYTSKGNCDTLSIDLNSQSPQIQEANFLSPTFNPVQQDVIVCSMVLNCVPNARLRGEMINKINGLLPVGGEVFVVLPLLCLAQSQFINRKSYENIWIKLGYELKEIRVTPKLHMIWGVKRREGDGEGWKEGKGKVGGKNTFGIQFENSTSNNK
ncbi:hypothetical protein TrST_g7223 [Triparma strigata]|uniref:25S rRNA adenine-N(1) methyltransferase n=1 Tax=Triparma strigata TaxID=1606541 RepID=A0A9W6ZWI6_9STRA|nr:hypothetical protein TrST_g7223 [Triparma strigata]